jgi:hypothetical protein
MHYKVIVSHPFWPRQIGSTCGERSGWQFAADDSKQAVKRSTAVQFPELLHVCDCKATYVTGV